MPAEYRRTLTDDERDRLFERHERTFGKAWTRPQANDVERDVVTHAVEQEQNRRRETRKRKRRAA